MGKSDTAKYYSKAFGGFQGWVAMLWRSLQLIDALVIIGCYAVDLDAARKASKYSDGKWVNLTNAKTGALMSLPPELTGLLTFVKILAVATGGAAALTSIMSALFIIIRSQKGIRWLWFIEPVIVLLFTILSAIFGSMFLHEKVEMEAGIHRMKVAMGFDFAGLFLWVVSAAVVVVKWYRTRSKSFPRREIPDAEWQGDGGIKKPKGISLRTLRH